MAKKKFKKIGGKVSTAISENESLQRELRALKKLEKSKKELAKTKREIFERTPTGKVVSRLQKGAGVVDKTTGQAVSRLKKFGRKRLKGRKILRRAKQATVVINQPVAEEPQRSHFFNSAVQQERRNLFFR
mgnify:FL=1|jgi:hypothetical protein